MIAIQHSHADVVEILLGAGANLDLAKDVSEKRINIKCCFVIILIHDFILILFLNLFFYFL